MRLQRDATSDSIPLRGGSAGAFASPMVVSISATAFLSIFPFAFTGRDSTNANVVQMAAEGRAADCW